MIQYSETEMFNTQIHLRNDLYCVGCDVKLYSFIHPFNAQNAQ